MGFLWMWQWYVKDGSNTVTRPALSTGEGLRTFRWLPSTWTVGPEMKVNWPVDSAKIPDNLNLHEHPCENFTTTTSCLEMSARNYQWRLRKIPRSKPEMTQLWKGYVFCYQHAKRMHRLGLAGCFLCCVVHVYTGNFTYKKNYPTKGKGQEVIACLWWTFTVKNRRLNVECMPGENSDSDKQDPALCKWKFLSNSLLCT